MASDFLCENRKNVNMSMTREQLSEWLSEQFKAQGKSRGKKKGDLAKMWGAEPSAVTRVLNDERAMKAQEYEIAKAFFANDDDGSEFTHSQGGIPEINVRAGAGGGGIALQMRNGDYFNTDDIKAEWIIPGSYIRGELRIAQSAVRIVEVLGDSMEPTLKTGDRVLIDTNHKVPSPPGVYAVWDGYGVVIKRIEQVRNVDRPMVRLISDNKNHAAYEVSIEEAAIIGRVVCKVSVM